ncbi:HEAT repeat domain-containing protein, partial [Sphingopyxis sp. RIFCSPHIGHO2_12_FULL_65_19]|uniref:HEAT repeat domain-containing protein n=1 Tax=Sphingopyxis sp. RIFCSPHIGHO2_12_FULL_65_19 TaxID=1802172 RepID=UPI0025E2EA87
PLRLVGGGDGGAGGLVLADRGAIRLSLQLRPDPAKTPAPATAIFVPGRAALHILADGGASITLHDVAVTRAEEDGAFTASAAASCRPRAPRSLRTGETLILDTARQSFTLGAGGAGRAGGGASSGDVLLLELAVQPPSRLPIRAYDIASGRLARVSASRRDSSFRAMALALLREFGRADAAPLFAAEAASEDFAARWNAMRELAALDAAAARPLLAAMAAADPHPEVRRAAAATHALLSPPSDAPRAPGRLSCRA